MRQKRCERFQTKRTSHESDVALSSSAFTKVLFSRKSTDEPLTEDLTFRRTLRIQIHVPRVSSDCCVAILGDQPLLGNWMEQDILLMNDTQFPLWSINLDADKLKLPLQFKYVIYNKINKHIVIWEQGSNRMIRDYVCKEPLSLK